MSTDGKTLPPPASLGTHSARGLVYLIAGSTATKAIGILSQLALLYLLGRRDFGVVTLAYTITEFALIVGQSGVADVLIHRRAFKQWAVPGFWLSAALGLASCLLILLAAPIATRVYGETQAVRDQLFWVLIVLAPSPLIFSLSVVPRAQLSRQLQFRALASLNLGEIALTNLLTVLFAAIGFGPFSFVLPAPIGGAIVTLILWTWVRPHWSPRLRLRRWRYLIGDSSHLLSSELGRKVIDQSDYISLGIKFGPEIVGIYNVGFRFSIQMMRLLMVNMQSILFPAFTKLNDQPQQQYQGFFRAQRILAMVGVSSCLLQAAIAQPTARILFPSQWLASIPVMQILSLGMATRMVSGAAYALMKSHGRFKAISVCYWCCALIQLPVLALVLWLGGGLIGVAVVVSVVAALVGPLMFYISILPFGGGWREVGQVLARPIVSGIVSVGVAWLIAEWLKDHGYNDIVQFIEINVVAVALNALCAWIWMRPVCDDLLIRIRRLLPNRAVT